MVVHEVVEFHVRRVAVIVDSTPVDYLVNLQRNVDIRSIVPVHTGLNLLLGVIGKVFEFVADTVIFGLSVVEFGLCGFQCC